MKKLPKKLSIDLFYLSMLSFVFTGSVALSMTGEKLVTIEFPVQKQVRTYSPIPILTGGEQFPVVSAQGVVAVDLESSTILYEKNPDLALAPASTTKIMTALVALDYYSPNQKITVGNNNVTGQKMNLVPGEVISANDLLYGLLVFSGNDAAEVIAENYPGGRDTFIAAMNNYAGRYALKNTRFQNPSGLDSEGHVATAQDLVRLTEIALRDKRFTRIVGTQNKTVASVDGRIVHHLKSTNELLGEEDGVLGVKTGWTELARENLVTLVEREDKKIIIALLGSQDRFGETRELIDWIYGNYEWQEVGYPKQ